MTDPLSVEDRIRAAICAIGKRTPPAETSDKPEITIEDMTESQMADLDEARWQRREDEATQDDIRNPMRGLPSKKP